MKLNNKINSSGLISDLNINPEILNRYDDLRSKSGEDTIINCWTAMFKLYLNCDNYLSKAIKKSGIGDNEVKVNLKQMRLFMLRLFASLDEVSQNNLYKETLDVLGSFLVTNTSLPASFKESWKQDFLPTFLSNEADIEKFGRPIKKINSSSNFRLKVAEILNTINIEAPEYNETVKLFNFERDKDIDYLKSIDVLNNLIKLEVIIKSPKEDLTKEEIKKTTNEIVSKINKDWINYELDKIKSIENVELFNVQTYVFLNETNYGKKMFFENVCKSELGTNTIILGNIGEVSKNMFVQVGFQPTNYKLYEKLAEFNDKKMIKRGDFKDYIAEINVPMFINSLMLRASGKVTLIDVSSSIYDNEVIERDRKLKELSALLLKGYVELSLLEKKGLGELKEKYNEEFMKAKNKSVENLVKDFLKENVLDFLDSVNIGYEFQYIKSDPVLKIKCSENIGTQGSQAIFDFIEKNLKTDKNLDELKEKISNLKEYIQMANDVAINRSVAKQSVRKF